MNYRETDGTQAGNSLVVTLITMAVIGVFIDLSLQYTNNIGHNVQRSLLLRQATNIADASTEMSFSAWRAICRTNQTKIFPKSNFDTEIPTPTPGNFPGVPSYNLLNYSVVPLDSYWVPRPGGADKPIAIAGPNHGDLNYFYLATADVVVPTETSKTASNLAAAAALTDPGNVVARVRRVFQKEEVSLWRWAVLYDDDMEIHPGANMVINGDVHTNGDLYTGHSLLTLNGKTTYTDDWTIGFMPGENAHSGETPQSPHWATGMPPASDQAQAPYGIYLDDYHQLIEYTTTKTPLDPYRFQTQAGIVVTIDASNNIKVYKGSDGGDITGNSKGIAVKNAITTNQTITDNREGATTGNATVRLASLNVGTLTNVVNSATLGGEWNGVIYIVDTSADPNGVTTKRAIRLTDGGVLPNGGLTVVSGNPVYVQGDFNTGSILGTTQPPSNSTSNPDPTKPTVTGYTRQPAAIIGDAVTVLSNSWLDSKSGTVPDASNTTVNAAIVSGIVPSGNGYYSGGVENFPRFLEDWGGKNFTYYGSMIELYKSKQAIGKWGSANVYSAPNRAWYFDNNFIYSPPPGLLASFNYRRSYWYTQ